MAFDASTFLDTAIKGELSTSRPLFPEGEYVIEVKDLEIKETSNPLWVMLNLDSMVDADEEVATLLGKKENPFSHKFTIPLEIDEKTGGLAMGEGKNIILGQARAAVGQNNAAKPWKFTDLIGNEFLIKITHRKNKQGNMQDGISAITSIDEVGEE